MAPEDGATRKGFLDHMRIARITVSLGWGPIPRRRRLAAERAPWRRKPVALSLLDQQPRKSPLADRGSGRSTGRLEPAWGRG